MKSFVRDLMKSDDLESLASYVRDNFGLNLAENRLRSLLAQATSAGGPDDDPWTDGTWRMWLKAKATEPQQPEQVWATEPMGSSRTSQARPDLQTALLESSAAILTTADFEFRDLPNWNDLRCGDEFPEETWTRLFPATESVGQFLQEQFRQYGGKDFLGTAPFASWLYARLVFLGIDDIKEEDDLGGYQIYFVVNTNNHPAGVLFLEADSEVEVFVEAQTSDVAAKIKEQFVGLLLGQIKDVARCELEVHGAEVAWTNYYGWSGHHFLGDSNASE